MGVSEAIHPETRIGHVHLRVADLERALVFYRGVLGFEVQQRFGETQVRLNCLKLWNCDFVTEQGDCAVACHGSAQQRGVCAQRDGGVGDDVAYPGCGRVDGRGAPYLPEDVVRLRAVDQNHLRA